MFEIGLLVPLFYIGICCFSVICMIAFCLVFLATQPVQLFT